MANDYVDTIDLDGEQWDMKDAPITDKIGNADISSFGSTVTDAILGVYNSIQNTLNKKNTLNKANTRNTNENPSWYIRNTALTLEFKQTSVISASSITDAYYGMLITLAPWTDTSGGLPIQLYFTNGGGSGNRAIGIRYANNANSWGSWSKLH